MRKIIQEFKTFISRGNVIDMAVGVIIGSAFTKIVNSLVEDILMQIVTGIIGQMDFTHWIIPLGSAGINIGSFISSVISFLAVALVVFFLVKGMNKMRDITGKEKKAEAPSEKECPYCKTSISIKATRCPHCTSILEESP